MAADQEPPRRAEHQLPPGRHNLPRSYVQANQQQRILDAVIDVTGLVGYVAMSVEDIIASAGVSRRTFYDHYRSKEDAFMSVLDAIGAELGARVRSALAVGSSFAEDVRNCLAACLHFLADEPRYADVLIVEVLAAGPEAIEKRNTAMSSFADLLREGAATLPGGSRPPDLTADTLVGGLYEVVYSRVLQGRTTELPSLQTDLAYSVMQPYLGHAAAKREASKAPSPEAIAG